MLQCLCGRSLRSSSSLSGEKMFFPQPQSCGCPALFLLSGPLSATRSPPLICPVNDGRKAFPYWGEIAAPSPVLSLDPPPEIPGVILALQNALAVAQRRSWKPRVSFRAVLPLTCFRTSRVSLSPCDLRGRRATWVAPSLLLRSCRCFRQERGLLNRWLARQVSFLFLVLSGKQTYGHRQRVRFTLEIKQSLN